MSTKPGIVKFTQLARDSFIGAEHVYKNGSCYYFAKMLEHLFPGGKLVENHDHVYYLYKDKHYDIGGEVTPFGETWDARVPTPHGKYDLLNALYRAKGV